jgi:hypothetical protein
MAVLRRVGDWLAGPVWRRVSVGVAAVAVMVLAAQALSVVPAKAFTSPRGHHQFVQISSRGTPLWKATMQLYNRDGNLVYQWHRGYRPGGKETWWFTVRDGYVNVEVTGRTASGRSTEGYVFIYRPGNRAPDGHCFHVEPLGYVKYMGDSTTEDCTPD